MRARSTGVEIIDEVLGGITPGLPCVIAGPAGSGRTVVSLQLAAAGVEQGRIVSLLCNEPAPLLLRQASALGLDLTEAIESERLAVLEMDSEVAAVTSALGSEALIEAVRTEQPLCSLLIVDPLSVITTGIFDESHLRAVARGLVASAPDWMMVFTVESERLALQAGLERTLGEISGAFLSLTNEVAGRRLTVERTRTGVPRRPFVDFEIASGGARVLELPGASVTAPETGAGSPNVLSRRMRNASAPEQSHEDPHDIVSPPVPSRRDDRQSGPDSNTEAERRPVVLVVDSDRQSREQIVKWLDGIYEILEAGDGFDAMTWLMTRPPDLVILDLLMPRVTGYELLGAIQRSGQTVPRLVISGSLKRPGDRLAPLVLGATDILAKPLERFELVRKVEMLLRLESTPAELMDPDDAEGLFARISKTRLLSQTDFEARLDRACKLGERLGLPSSMVTVSSTSARALDAFLEAADESMRFEDATMRVSPRRAVLLLVATVHEDAPGATERLCEIFAARGGRTEQLTLRIRTAQRVKDDHAWQGMFRERDESEEPEAGPGPLA